MFAVMCLILVHRLQPSSAADFDVEFIKSAKYLGQRDAVYIRQL